MPRSVRSCWTRCMELARQRERTDRWGELIEQSPGAHDGWSYGLTFDAATLTPRRSPTPSSSVLPVERSHTGGGEVAKDVGGVVHLDPERREGPAGGGH